MLWRWWDRRIAWFTHCCVFENKKEKEKDKKEKDKKEKDKKEKGKKEKDKKDCLHYYLTFMHGLCPSEHQD